jgi:hypothetical protein
MPRDLNVRLAAWGCAIGIVISLMLTSILKSLLFETSARDPMILMARGLDSRWPRGDGLLLAGAPRE